jgi:hypothetical protein
MRNKNTRLEFVLCAWTTSTFQHPTLMPLIVCLFRRTPTRVSGPSLIAALRPLEEIRALGVAELDLSRIPAGRLKALARHTATSWAAVIARMPSDRRVATLLAFARAFEATALDDALDLLDLIITDPLAQASLALRVER